MPKYVATRKDICAGLLLQTSGGLICRELLFNVNEDGLANDLIYTTPTNYQIEGIQPKVNVESEFIINRYVELEELLKYLKYGVDLTQNDLNQIYRKLITHKWWLEHHRELFGWKDLGDGSYGSGGIQVIPMSIFIKLSSINCCKHGKPYKAEPGYSLIKKRR